MDRDHQHERAKPRRIPPGLRPFVVPAVLVGLAAVLATSLFPLDIELAPVVETPAWAIDTTPVRQPALHSRITIGVYTYRCSECHMLFPSPPETDRPLTQHRDIVLEHGINDRCFNCHHRQDRDAFADDRGGPIPYDQPQMLCAKCHGLVYRDWTHGVHGRTNGYWDADQGPVRRLKCIECHDPHAPAFAAMRPAPPPDTLRTPAAPAPAEHDTRRNPLLGPAKGIPRRHTGMESKKVLPDGGRRTKSE